VTRIDLIFFDAGGGHRAAATALKQQIESEGRPWSVRLVNLQEELDALDIFRRFLGLRLQDVYNLLLRKGWTLGSPFLLRAMQFLILGFHPLLTRRLTRFWSSDTPQLVVSLIPNFNRQVFVGLRGATQAPYITCLTDIADYPPRFWIENRQKQEQHIICGSAKAAAQAKQLGHEDQHVHQVSGMILNPRFYQLPTVARDAELKRLGLDPALPVALVMFGGYGSSAMPGIAAQLAASPQPVQMIVICGRNEKLRQQFLAMPLPRPAVIEGFTNQVPYYMQLADFFIGKPGPGSISEALQMHLPVVVECNAWTLPQERYNAEWIREQGVGIVLHSFRELSATLPTMLDQQKRMLMREKAAALRNRAIFEIPEILARLIN
jgi:hypothetical protein